MGSSELRALATTHGRELTEIALRHAAHDPRTLLRWSERTRATALAQPPATSDAATIPASLAALRDNGRRLAEARQAGEPTEDLEKERLRLERAVRTESHTQSAADTDPQRPASVEEIVAGVGDGCLVELVDVDGTLHVLVVHNGRVRRKVAGTTAEVADLLGPAAMLLRRASRGRPANTADLGRRLQDAILGDAARLIPDGPVTLVPTARLHGLAWSLLPALHDRPFGIVPSAGQWLRATRYSGPTRAAPSSSPDPTSSRVERRSRSSPSATRTPSSSTAPTPPRGSPGAARRRRPRAPRDPRSVPRRQPALLGARPGRRSAHRSRPRATADGAVPRRALRLRVRRARPGRCPGAARPGRRAVLHRHRRAGLQRRRGQRCRDRRPDGRPARRARGRQWTRRRRCSTSGALRPRTRSPLARRPRSSRSGSSRPVGPRGPAGRAYDGPPSSRPRRGGGGHRPGRPGPRAPGP